MHFLELNLRLSTYNIGAFSATGSHFYDLILGKAWLSPHVSTSSNGVRVAVIDAWDGMEDEEDFLTPLELRLRARDYLTFMPTSVEMYAKYQQLRSGVNLLSSFRGGDQDNLYLAQVADKGPDEEHGVASRVPTSFLSNKKPVLSFFRSRQDAHSSLVSFLHAIAKCPEVQGVQDATIMRSVATGNLDSQCRGQGCRSRQGAALVSPEEAAQVPSREHLVCEAMKRRSRGWTRTDSMDKDSMEM